MDLSTRSWKIAAGSVVAIIVALIGFKLRQDRLRHVDPYAVERFNFSEDVDWGPLEEINLLVAGQSVIDGEITVEAGSTVAIEAETKFRNPGPPGTSHLIIIAYRPVVDGEADWSEIRPGNEWRLFLGNDDPTTRRIKAPPGDYELRVYMAVENMRAVERKLKMYHLGKGRAHIVKQG